MHNTCPESRFALTVCQPFLCETEYQGHNPASQGHRSALGKTVTSQFSTLHQRLRGMLTLLGAVVGLVLLAGHVPVAAQVAVTEVSLSDSAERAELRVSVERAVGGATYFALDGPNRMVIDLRGARASSAAPKTSGTASLISSLRQGQFDARTTRIVIDLKDAARLASAEWQQPDPLSTRHDLVISLAPVAASDFARAVANGRQKIVDPAGLAGTARAPAAPPTSSPPAAAAPVSTAKAAAPRVAEAPRPAAPAPAPVAVAAKPATPPPTPSSAPAARGQYKPIIVLDAGHGGKDPGAPSVLKHKSEKDVTLAIAREIRRQLEATGRYKVVLTRDSDVFLTLNKRVEVARAAGADLFMSIHADSFGRPDVRGATVYTFSEKASDREAARYAARENESDLLADFEVSADSPDVANILFDLMQRETLNKSAQFANIMTRKMARHVPMRPNPYRFAGFVVLKAPDVPTVLLETGYMSNAEDARFLMSAKGQAAIAQGVVDSVDAYFEERRTQTAGLSGIRN